MIPRNRPKREPKGLGRPMTPADLREMFPDARLLCQCVEDRDVCPSSCDYFKRMQGEIRGWLAKEATA